MGEGLKRAFAAAKATREKPKKEPKRPPICEGCGVNRADPPGRLCVGCEAYKEHQQ